MKTFKSFYFLLAGLLMQDVISQYCVDGDFFFLEVNPADTFEAKRLQCQNLGGELASFNSESQYNGLISLLALQQVFNSFWLGIEHITKGTDAASTPQDFVYTANVVGDDTSFFSSVTVGQPPWALNEPNGALNEFQQCVKVERSIFGDPLEIFDTSCDESLAGICRIPSACIESFDNYAIQCVEENGVSDMYIVTDTIVNQEASNTNCGEFFPGATPLNFDSFDGYLFTRDLINFIPSTFWTDIVLSQAGIPETASYQNNADSDFLLNEVHGGNIPPWANNEPNGNGTHVVITESFVLATEAPEFEASLACRLKNSLTCQNIPQFTLSISSQETPTPTGSYDDYQGVDSRQFCFAEDSLTIVSSFSDFDSGDDVCDGFTDGLFDGIETLAELNKISLILEEFLLDQEIPTTTGLWIGFKSNSNGTTSSNFESVNGNDVATNFISTLIDGQAPWAAGQPSGNDLCVGLFSGFLEVVPCSDNNIFLCARRNDDFCSGETTCVGNTQARIIANSFSFDDAEAKCEEFGANSALFAITSQEEYDAFVPFFNEVRANFGDDDFWTGYQTDEASSNPADYLHTSSILKRTNDFIQLLSNGVSPWDNSQPLLGSNCVVVNSNNLLESADCSGFNVAMCTEQYAQECATQKFCTEDNVEFLYFSDEFDSLTHSSNCADLLGASAAVMDSFTEFEQVRDAFSSLGISAWTDYEMTFSPANPPDIIDRTETSPFLGTSPFNEFPWAADEPIFVSLTECLDFGSELTSQDCLDLKPGICRINDSPSCFEPQPDSRCLNNVTYILIPDTESFFDAQEICVVQGGNLVTPSSFVEMALITSLLVDNEVSGIWSGIFALSPGSEASTLDYSFITNNTEGLDFIQGPLGVYPWFAGQPLSFEESFPLCAFFSNTFNGAELLINGCFDDLAFICEIENACDGLVVPDEWFCDPILFNDGQVCNCRCGAFDPDCETIAPDVQPECDEGIVCNAAGTCDLSVPAEWICPVETYNALDGCDCNCGAPDPDCDRALVPDQINNNCDGTCIDGICLDFNLLNPTQTQCTGEDADFYFHTPLTFDEATDICDNFLLLIFQGNTNEFPSTELAPIASLEDIDAFLSISKGFDLSTGIHVGIVADSDGSQASLPQDFAALLSVNDSFVTQRQVGEFPWAQGEPNEIIAGRTCTTLGADGLLVDTSCDIKRQFICRVPQLCENNEEDEGFGITCLGTDLVGSESSGSYEEIQDFCDGNELVAVASEEALNAFNRVMSQGEIPAIWAAIDAIELGSNATPANFNFLNDQEGIDFFSSVNRGQFPWEINEPDASGDCVIVDKNSGLLQDTDCNEEFPAFCAFLPNFCNGVTGNDEGTVGPTPSPIVVETEAPTISPTQSPTERVSTCSRRTFGITNPTKFF